MLASYLSFTKLLVHSSEINIFQLTITIKYHAFSLAIISFDKYIDNSYKDKLIIRTREIFNIPVKKYEK